MWCGASTHGAFYRADKPGFWACPFYEGVRLELHSLGIHATITDLDNMIALLRERGNPTTDEDPGSEPPSASSSSAPPPKPAAAPAKAAPKASYPVGGAPAPKKSSAKQAKSPTDSNGAKPVAAAPSKQPVSRPAQKAPAKQTQPSNPVQQKPPQPAIAQNSVSPASAYQQPVAAVAAPTVHEHEEEEDLYDDDDSLYPDETEHQNGIASAPVDVASPEEPDAHPNAMHLKMHQINMGPARDLVIHTPIVQTASAMLYGATLKHSWVKPTIEVVVKLSRLPTDPEHRQQQQALMDSEISAWNTFNRAYHPNLVAMLGHEAFIQVGPDSLSLIVMEKCDDTLAKHLQTLMNTLRGMNPRLQAPLLPHHIARAYSEQIVQAYHFLHKHARYHQRPINPSNILVSSASPQDYPFVPVSSPSPITAPHVIKISDFSFHLSGSAAVAEPFARTFLAPEDAKVTPLVPPASVEEALRLSLALENGRAADLWSIGCVLYYVGTGGQQLFKDEAERDDLPHRTTHLKRHGLEKSSPLLLDLINRLTLPSPNDRPTLDLVRHHPALWKPHFIVDFICLISAELEKPNNPRSGLIFDIVASRDFFAHSFPKQQSWESFVLPNWLSSWKDWVTTQQGKPWDPVLFKSIRSLLKFLASTAATYDGGVHGRSQLGHSISLQLHHLILSLWSYLQPLGEYDDQYKFTFLS